MATKEADHPAFKRKGENLRAIQHPTTGPKPSSKVILHRNIALQKGIVRHLK
jgi:hypothetical protein